MICVTSNGNDSNLREEQAVSIKETGQHCLTR